MAEWHYADGEQTTGPISQSDFDHLVATGIITPQTLVWKPGMAEWQPYASLVRSASAHAPIPQSAVAVGEQVQCAECGQSLPIEEAIQYNQLHVCAACKPVFFQKLREGVAAGATMTYGGFWVRFLAKFIDGLLVLIVNTVTSKLIELALGGTEVGQAIAVSVSLMLNFAVQIGYYVYFLGKKGATPGKMALNLKVVRPDGQPITYMRALGRYFAESLNAFTLMIGYVMAGFDSEKRALHDRICDTRVIKVG